MDSSATSIFLVSHTHFMQFRKSDRENSFLQGNKFRFFFLFLHMFEKKDLLKIILIAMKAKKWWALLARHYILIWAQCIRCRFASFC